MNRPALVTCPRCHRHACLVCWHGAIRICDRCLVADPAAAAPPIAFETRGLAGLPATLLAAFSPLRTAPAFAYDIIGYLEDPDRLFLEMS